MRACQKAGTLSCHGHLRTDLRRLRPQPPYPLQQRPRPEVVAAAEGVARVGVHQHEADERGVDHRGVDLD